MGFKDADIGSPDIRVTLIDHWALWEARRFFGNTNNNSCNGITGRSEGSDTKGAKC